MVRFKNWSNFIWNTILLWIFWLLISWSFDWISMIMGLVFSVFISFFMAAELLTSEESPSFIKKPHKFFIYVFILLREVIKANVQVVQIVLSRKLDINPEFITIKQEVKKPVTQALWGNSITLTPGTLTIDIDDQEILIHVLDRRLVEGLKNNPVLKALQDFEGGH